MIILFSLLGLLAVNLEELQIQTTGARDWHRDDDVAEEIPYYHSRTLALAHTKDLYLTAGARDS